MKQDRGYNRTSHQFEIPTIKDTLPKRKPEKEETSTIGNIFRIIFGLFLLALIVEIFRTMGVGSGIFALFVGAAMIGAGSGIDNM